MHLTLFPLWLLKFYIYSVKEERVSPVSIDKESLPIINLVIYKGRKKKIMFSARISGRKHFLKSYLVMDSDFSSCEHLGMLQIHTEWILQQKTPRAVPHRSKWGIVNMQPCSAEKSIKSKKAPCLLKRHILSFLTFSPGGIYHSESLLSTDRQLMWNQASVKILRRCMRATTHQGAVLSKQADTRMSRIQC